KICGITREEDAIAAAELGADAIGLNFYARSPRSVTTEQATRIAHVLPLFVEPVLLFVNEPWTRVLERAQALAFARTLQWHGDQPEPPFPGPFRFILAFPIRQQSDLEKVEHYLETCRHSGVLPDALLLDGHAPGEYGGTGQPAPWRLLADFHPGV